MSYVGNKPAQTTIPADDAVTTAMLQDDAVTSAKIAGTTIVNADINASAGIANSKMASDTTSASNISTGTLGSARMGSGSASSSTILYGDGTWKAEPATDTSGLEDDIALLGFRVASNGSLAKYNLVDQTVDDFQDATGVNAGSSTNEVRNSSNYYSGSTTGGTGGTITTYTDGGTDYKVHTFTAAGNFVLDGAGDANILVVAGGGSGGYYSSGPSPGAGGGAGGGGVLEGTLSLTSATFAITVGAGGAQNASGGNSGIDSVWDTGGTPATADGGGAGNTVVSGSSSGGSGGGGASNQGGQGTSTQSDSGGLTGYGYAGGDPGAATRDAGGGGGAGAVGGGSGGYNSGAGGAGRGNVYRTGVTQYYAGGGGGGHDSQSGNVGAGGSGGGGAGGKNASGTAGTANTGGGGGGGNSGAAGGSGIVIVRYVDGAMASDNNMTLISTTTAAQAAPTKGDVVFTYTNGAGSTTLGTDVTAEISADGGSTWTAMTLGSEGSTGSHNIVTAHDVTITSTITAPWNMAYRIKTLNQSASKTTRIQAVSLGWS